MMESNKKSFKVRCDGKKIIDANPYDSINSSYDWLCLLSQPAINYPFVVFMISDKFPDQHL